MIIDIAITSDFICPWCFIGERRLARALAYLPDGTEVALQWKPFELNPGMPAEGVERRAYRTQKFGSWERGRQLDAQVMAAASDDGIAFDYDAMTRTPNTFAAHRLMQLAQREGVATALAQALFAAYFEQGRDLGDAATLADLAAQAGLDRAAALAYLAGDDGSDAVRAAERDGMARGIRGVPLFDIGGEVVSGAQPLEVFVLALQRAFDRASQPATA